jgi:imidazolonepropionase-like amidohydrolase
VPKVRVVLWEAAIAAANGLRANRARRALTLDAALILGIDDRVGSIEPGKSADLVVFDGDPLEITSHVCAVVIDGLVVSETCR